jgi:hypothetical protein
MMIGVGSPGFEGSLVTVVGLPDDIKLGCILIGGCPCAAIVIGSFEGKLIVWGWRLFC